MASAPTPNPPSVVLDACFVIAFCAKEPGRYPRAQAELDTYAKGGWQFFAPAVVIAESLYVFCRKLHDGQLTAAEHAQAVQSLQALMQATSPPPNGEPALIARANQIRGTYGC